MSIIVHGERKEIRDLWRLVLRFVFAEGTCPPNTQKVIEANIMNWKEFVDKYKAQKFKRFGETETDAAPLGKKGTYIDEVENQIQAMSYLLVKNENGDLESKKDTYRKHQIDFRDTQEWGWAFPERQKNYARGLRALEENKRDRPEDYK